MNRLLPLALLVACQAPAGPGADPLVCDLDDVIAGLDVPCDVLAIDAEGMTTYEAPRALDVRITAYADDPVTITVASPASPFPETFTTTPGIWGTTTTLQRLHIEGTAYVEVFFLDYSDSTFDGI